MNARWNIFMDDRKEYGRSVFNCSMLPMVHHASSEKEKKKVNKNKN